MWKRITLAYVVTALTAGAALAQPQTQPSPPQTQPSKKPPAPAPTPAPAPAGASAEVKAGKGVEKHAIVDEGSSFAKGDMVWVWSRVSGANGTTVKHVWKFNGNAEWTAYLKIGSNRWTTQSRRRVKPGSYSVEVQAADGSVIGSVDFTVQ